jgi:hypothetical protein
MSEALNIQNDPWRPVLGGDQTVAAVTVAQEVATRLQDLNQIEVATAAVAQQTAFPKAMLTNVVAPRGSPQRKQLL